MTKYTAFRCPVELLEKLRVKAASQRRSLSNYLITLIEKDAGGDDAAATAGSKRPKPPLKPSARKKVAF